MITCISATLPQNKIVIKARETVHKLLVFLKRSKGVHINPSLEKMKDWLKWCFRGLKLLVRHTFSSAKYYLDLIKNTMLLIVFYMLLSQVESPPIFYVHLLQLLAFVLIIPILLIGIYISVRCPYVIFNCSEKDIELKHQAVCLLLSPLLLGILLFKKTYFTHQIELTIENIERKSSKMEQHHSSGLVTEVCQIQSNLLRKKFLQTLMLELQCLEFSLETTIQTSMQVCIILLNTSATPTEPLVYQSVLAQTSNVVRNVTIVLFLLSCAQLELKGKFVNTAAKLLAALKGILFGASSITAIVAFFTPVLGLFDMLAHWQYEQIPFDENIFPRNFPYTVGKELQYINFEVIERGNYSLGVRPEPSLYTVLDRDAWIAYLILVYALALISLFIIKMSSSKEYRADFLGMSRSKAIVHLYGTINMPLLYSEFADCTQVILTVLQINIQTNTRKIKGEIFFWFREVINKTLYKLQIISLAKFSRQKLT